MKTITNATYPAFVLIAFACFAVAAQAPAVCQEGCLTNNNTALGDDALISVTGGLGNNTAVGFSALELNTTGDGNTASGAFALQFNTGSENTANGVYALYSNKIGDGNTASGDAALFSNTDGSQNTAIGQGALYDNTTGEANTASGANALSNNTTGSENTAMGFWALGSNTAGDKNTAVGAFALSSNTGNHNIALGYYAGYNLTGRYNIDIGAQGTAGESNTIRIGTRRTHTKTFIAGISGATVPDGVGVIVGMNGKLGTIVSSRRFKEKIKPMDKTSEAILELKPVTFRYKEEVDPEGIPQFGLIAEEVAKVNPELVLPDKEGKPYTVRYDAVNAMLLNEFLKEHRKNEKQEATIARQQKQIEALTASLQKVSARLETAKPAPQTAKLLQR